MANEYRIDRAGPTFVVVGPDGERVAAYRTVDAAKRAEGRCRKEDAMYETAKTLVDIAIKAHMDMFGVDRETASYWIGSASEAT